MHARFCWHIFPVLQSALLQDFSQTLRNKPIDINLAVKPANQIDECAKRFAYSRWISNREFDHRVIYPYNQLIQEDLR